jgi:hypothetical protein
MRAEDVKREIDHAISTEVGLPLAICQTGDEYRVYSHKLSVKQVADQTKAETILCHWMAAQVLAEIAELLQDEPKSRLFWREPPTFVPATPVSDAAIRARFVITEAAKVYDTVEQAMDGSQKYRVVPMRKASDAG